MTKLDTEDLLVLEVIKKNIEIQSLKLELENMKLQNKLISIYRKYNLDDSQKILNDGTISEKEVENAG